jgi:D-alanine-D-alanine ligase
MAKLGTAVVLHTSVPDGAPADELDALDQARAVSASLIRMGYDALEMPFAVEAPVPGGDMLRRLTEGSLADAVKKARPKFVFNLVETVSASGAWSCLAPALLTRLGLQYTGSAPGAIFLSTHKIAAKMLLRKSGIATPPWVTQDNPDSFSEGRYILKPLYEDASVGMDQSSVGWFTSSAQLAERIRAASEAVGCPYFAERYVEGREFSVAMISEGGLPRILPPSEIQFSGYEALGKHRIVDYRAKWDAASFEYHNTRATHRFPEEDGVLLTKLRAAAMACWTLFDLRGYARVDFRVDESGTPWVLEVNCNPCITPGASGFLSAARVGGLSFDDVVRMIADEALADPDEEPVMERIGT